MNHRDLDTLDRPLFGGGPTSTDRVINLVVGTVTAVMVVATVILAIAFYSKPRAGVNIYFAVVILLICGSHIVLIYWYRQGDLDPKFRRMIFYNALTIVLLCIAGNLYINGGLWSGPLVQSESIAIVAAAVVWWLAYTAKRKLLA